MRLAHVLLGLEAWLYPLKLLTSYLYQKLEKFMMLHMIAFIDPIETGALGCGNPTEMARSLSACYAKGSRVIFFWCPITQVVKPIEEVIHFMDPLKRRLITGEWKTTVDKNFIVVIMNLELNQNIQCAKK